MDFPAGVHVGRLPYHACAVRIRTATVEDCPALADFLALAFSEDQEYFDPTPLREIEDEIKAGDNWLIAEHAGRIVGCVCAQNTDFVCGVIKQLAVEAKTRRTGYGDELMQEAERRLRILGCDEVIIAVMEYKPKWLFDSYEKWGYHVDPTIEAGLLVQPKKPCNAIYMAKDLV